MNARPVLKAPYAFKYGAMEEFGERDNHFEEDGEIISRKTIENSIDNGVAYCIREDGKIVGGLALVYDVNEVAVDNDDNVTPQDTGDANNTELWNVCN